MNKTALIGLGVLVIIGVAVFTINPFKKSSKPQQQASTDTLQQNEGSSDSQSISGTLRDLLARNLPMECSFTRTDEAGTTSGTVYLSGKKMRGDFEMTQSDGAQVSSSVIRDGEYGYTWTSQQPQGMKMKLDESDVVTEDEESSEKKQEPFALDKEDVDYTCKPWRADNSMFVPPSNIEFVDISKQVEQIQDVSDQLKDTQCSACDQVPAGAGREQCKKSLGCE